MKPESVKFKNLRSLSEFSYDYSPGITGIRAPNFSGKSNFADLGQRFAWTGLSPSGLSKKELLKWGTKEGYTEFTFSHEGNKYELVRNIHNGKEKLSSDSGDEWTDKKEVKEVLENIFGVSLELISEYCFIRQFELINIVTQNRSKRMDYILRLVGGDKAESIRKNLQNTINRVPVYYDHTEVIKERKNSLEEVKSSLSELNDKYKEKEEELSSYPDEEELRKIINKDIEEEVKEEIAGTDKEISSLEDQKDKVTSDIGSVPEEDPLTDEEIDYLRYCNDIIPQMKDIEDNLNSLICPGEVEDPSYIKDELQEMKNTFNTKKEEYQLIQKGSCPTCKRPFDEITEEDIESRKQELKDLKDRFDKKKSKYDTKKEEYDKYCRDYQEYKKNLHHYQSVLEDLKKKVPENQFDEEELKNKQERYKKYRDYLREYKRNQEEIDNISQKIADKKAHKNTLINKETVSRQDKKEAENKLENIKNIKSELQDISTEIKIHQEKINNYEQEISRLESEQEESRKNRQFTDLFKKARDVFHKDNLPSRVLADRRIVLNKYLDEYLNDIDSGFTAHLDKSFSFLINFTDGGSNKSVEDLSGGQKIILAIVFHLVKLHLLPQVPFLMLDEPTSYLSRKLVGEVGDIFNSFAGKNKNRAYIMIPTHEDELDSCFTRTYKLGEQND